MVGIFIIRLIGCIGLALYIGIVLAHIYERGRSRGRMD